MLSDTEVSEIVTAFTQRGVVPTDAQAMALVKRFHLHIDQRPGKQISVQPPHFEEMICYDARKGHALDLNRAICECISRLRARKPCR